MFIFKMIIKVLYNKQYVHKNVLLCVTKKVTFYFITIFLENFIKFNINRLQIKAYF
jgi:hypothetical protein